MRIPIKNSSILVTGGAGFIGSHLVDSLIEQGAEKVVVIDNLFCGRFENLNDAEKSGKLVFYNDDAEIYSSLEYIFDLHDVDIVFNCATKALNYSFLNPSNAFMTNVNITSNILEFQRKKKFKTLVHFSTSEVYGTAVYEPMDESHPKNPTTTYAGGKAAADLAVETYVRMYNLDAFIVRPFNNYGPRQNFIGHLAGIIPLTVKKILLGGKPEIHGTGTQSRDFIYVEDSVNAIMKLYPIIDSGESVNISTNGQISVNALIEMICAEMNYSDEILRKESRTSDVFCHNASNDKIRGLIEFELTPFKAGLSKTIDWYKREIGKYYND